jgi:8-oxo-dGTP pyrophosphatase MutT (NUDIX family)
MYDMFVGGVSAAGEPPGTTLLRELQEEVGLDFARAPPPVPAPVTDPPADGAAEGAEAPRGRVGRAPQPGGKRAAEQLVAAYQASAPRYVISASPCHAFNVLMC